MAENVIQNSFHCKKPDCEGWWVNEVGVKTIVCPICNSRNCLQCKAIHTGLSCRTYKDSLVLNSQIIQTEEHLDTLLRTKAAQRCPNCGVSHI